MKAYFIRRLLLMIPTFLGITVLVFTITRFVPGGPIERKIAEYQSMSNDKMSMSSNVGGGAALSDEQLQELKEYYGFDKPIPVAYLIWLKKVLTGDLGESTRYSEPVWGLIKERFPISLFYGLLSMLITYSVCIPLGIFKAMKHGSIFDNISSAVIFFTYAIPGYVLGCFLIAYFAARWEWFPLGGFVGGEFEDLSTWGQVCDLFNHAVLPLSCYVIGSFALMTMMMKNTLMDNLAADYVRTALAKGVSYKRAIFNHALRNSLIPIATSFGNNISVILAGSFLIEKIFDIDGMGLLGYTSIIERDYPIVMGILVVSSLLQLAGNILSDICVALVDPRVKFK